MRRIYRTQVADIATGRPIKHYCANAKEAMETAKRYCVMHANTVCVDFVHYTNGDIKDMEAETKALSWTLGEAFEWIANKGKDAQRVTTYNKIINAYRRPTC